LKFNPRHSYIFHTPVKEGEKHTCQSGCGKDATLMLTYAWIPNIVYLCADCFIGVQALGIRETAKYPKDFTIHYIKGTAPQYHKV
jgi:hypothetical protein